MSNGANASSLADRSALTDALVDVGRGNRGAFADVYQRTSAKLFGVCLRILGNHSEAEEALQEAFINVWRKAGAFDPQRSSPITWLAALARNKAIDRLRARASRPAERLDDDALEIADPTPSAAVALESSEEGVRLAGCLEELEAKQANAIRNAFYQGATYAELATRDAIPLGTMKSWVRRGLLRLKDCLER